MRALLTGAFLAAVLAIPAHAAEDTKPILQGAELRAGFAHEIGYFPSINRPLTVVVGTDPAAGDNTYGYLRVRYMKWSTTKNKWVPMKKSGEYPKGWSRGHWNGDTHRFEAGFVNAKMKGKCKLIAHYQDSLTDETTDKDKRVFKCGKGFSS